MTCAQCSETTQLNSTQRASMDAGVKYLSVHIYLVTSVYQVLQSTWFAYWSVVDSGQVGRSRTVRACAVRYRPRPLTDRITAAARWHFILRQWVTIKPFISLHWPLQREHQQQQCDGLGKGKEEYLYSAFLHEGTHKVLRYGSHSFTCKQHHACLSFVSVHQRAPPQELRQQISNCSLLLIYRPQKDERRGWLTCSGWLTHLSCHPSTTGRAQDSVLPLDHATSWQWECLLTRQTD